MPPIQIVGHRGAKGEAPENTLPGFLHARALGLNAVEFDVHLSNDHELVVIHDNTIDRTTNGTGPVANFTAAELAALDARAAFPDWPDIIGVPRLDQVLDIVDDMPLIQIEIKTDTPDRLEEVVAGVLQHVDKRGIGQQALITSFDAVAVEICGRLAPDQARAFIGRPTDP
ncbi:MAG TPA: glycerophosphodiester phosphodiesterase family protein, partial [Thermomicrobiales bacterium]|nr:glycerophosphodiester phosphodiesterase family protein [Thermomicrobiales bacterium]